MKLKVVAFALLSSTSIAAAADLPARTYTKAPVYAAPVYNWTGFYAGAHVGAAFGNDNGLSGLGVFTTATSNGNDGAFLGGGQIGADYQFASNWVVGIEGQISGLSGNDRTIRGSGGNPNNIRDIIRDRNDWLASVTGRLGYTWGPGLIYAKGGVAFRDNDNVGVLNGFPGPDTLLVDSKQTGYTVGAGLEYMFAPAWSAKVEYQYYNFDHTNIALLSPGGTTRGTLSYNDDIHTVKVGVNYHFNWGGPVLAKY